MADFGYDITDHADVHPMFGTLEDFDALVEEAHRLDLKVILDYVPNHTSDRHPWFIESRSARADPKRDWFIWRDPAPDGGPPNNWVASFGGRAWEWDEATGQYYYHAYLPEQPTSTGATSRSGRRCSTCCASGWNAAWTASA
jgi:alpha-glucosidase